MIPTNICMIIVSYNGTDEELKTEKALRWLFLDNRKKFIWPYGDREETIHRFFGFYKIPDMHEVTDSLIKQHADYLPPNWATSNQVLKLLSEHQLIR